MSSCESGLKSRATRVPPTRRLPNRNSNIQTLDADIALKIRKALDTAPSDRNWRAVIAHLPERFSFSLMETEKFGLAQNKINGSPTTELMVHLGSRDFLVRDLIKCLDALGWEHLLLDLKPYEAIRVLSAPREKVKLTEGDNLTLSVTASGFPYPRYQWFKGNVPYTGATESTLSLSAVIVSDSGSYCCRLHNSADLDKIVFTAPTSVIVVGIPREVTRDTVKPKSCSVPNTVPPSVDRAPQILEQSGEVTTTVGAPFRLYVSAVGDQPLEFSWVKNGNHGICRCTTDEYRVDRSSVVDAASYECVVRNRFGEVRSNVMPVKVFLEPVMPERKATCVLDITAHPKSCAVERGGSALFFCQAIGEQPLNYQWYKDGCPIPGETRGEMAVRVINSFDQEGSFQCRVWNRSSELISAGAYLRLDFDVPEGASDKKTVHTATDKIALIIGNYDYTGTDLLKAPKRDVQVLAELLRSLDFKVVSLLNLTLGEMEAAVKEFCDLLQGDRQGDSGVYGLFYFVGHGIEEKGQCYLVPQDAPTGYSSSHCLCAQRVLQQMQDANPALCVMILDCCRINPDNPPEKPVESFPPRHKGNSLCLYATTLGMGAYEYEKREPNFPLSHMYRQKTFDEVRERVEEEPNGVLLKHLRRHICRRKPVEAIFTQVREDVGSDPKVHKLQIPTVNTNLVEPKRSLADKILYTGHTEVFQRRTQLWRNAHIKPYNRTVQIKPLGVTVDLAFSSEFSNVLSIILTVSDPGTTSDCYAWIVNLPPTLSMMDVGKLSDCPATTKTVLQDIQKLKEPLSLTIRLLYRDSQRQNCTYQHEPIDVGLPLISTLGLCKWERNRISSKPIPIEQGDDTHFYMNMSPGYVNAPPSHLGCGSASPFPSGVSSGPNSYPSKDVQYANI